MKPSVALKRYKEIIEIHNLNQHITIPTRKGTKIIDHIITNLQENKLITTNILPYPTVSDHDAPYIITNIPGIKFQTRTKYIRSMKHFNIKDYVDDFKTLPLALVYSFEDPNEQLDTLNNLILERIERHAPLVKTIFTHPPAPWMKQLDIADLQKKRDNCRYLAHYSSTEENWVKFRDIRNKLKSKMKEIKTAFCKKILSSKNSKEIWKVVHRILKPNDNTLKVDKDKLNKYFNNTAARLVSRKSVSKNELTGLIYSFNDKQNAFQLQPVTYENIEKFIKMIRNDCSTGYDHIPVTFIKPVSKFFVSAISLITNNFIKINQFPDIWKLTRISTIPKIQVPVELKDCRSVSILPILSKVN